jgi:hypothetical protein
MRAVLLADYGYVDHLELRSVLEPVAGQAFFQRKRLATPT